MPKKKKDVFRLHKERWKRPSGKIEYRNVIRLRGKYISSLKYSTKTAKLQKDIFIKRRTFTEGKKIKYKEGWKFKEISVRGIKRSEKELKQLRKNGRASSYMYWMRFRLTNGKIIYARSMQHPIDYDRRKAKEEAFDNAFARLSWFATKKRVYDEEEGLKYRGLIERRQEGIVYYS